MSEGTVRLLCPACGYENVFFEQALPEWPPAASVTSGSQLPNRARRLRSSKSWNARFERALGHRVRAWVVGDVAPRPTRVAERLVDLLKRVEAAVRTSTEPADLSVALLAVLLHDREVECAVEGRRQDPLGGCCSTATASSGG